MAASFDEVHYTQEPRDVQALPAATGDANMNALLTEDSEVVRLLDAKAKLRRAIVAYGQKLRLIVDSENYLPRQQRELIRLVNTLEDVAEAVV